MAAPDLPLRKPELQALFAAIGTEARLRTILGEFYRRMAADTMLGFFFHGRNIEAIANLQAEFLLRAMGERPSYSGKPPAEAHDELPPILPGHFDRRLTILREVLTQFGLPPERAATWITFEDAFRDSVVGKDSP